jgi:hypothetical protein
MGAVHSCSSSIEQGPMPHRTWFFIYALGVALLQPLCVAQTFWGTAGISCSLSGNFYSLYTSADGTWVGYGGHRDFDPDSSGWQNVLVKISSAGLQYIPVPGGIYTMVEYHDTLFVGGGFETSPNDSTPAYNVEFWHDGTWQHLGTFDEWLVNSLRVIDDTLYAVGSFTEVDGQPCTGMARLINGQWQPLPPIPEPDLGGIITDIIKYDGKLIATGGIYIGAQNGIAYLEGDQWHILGPGLEAGYSSVRCMAIYQGGLYIGGQIEITANNPGRDIMRWDGTQFHGLGAVGLQRYLGVNTSFSTVGGMVEHDGLLYVGGGFRFAGGQPSKGIATWNGIEWCSVPGNLSDGPGSGGVWHTAFLQDTLFVVCGYLADGDSVNLAAKFIGESYAGPCESDVSVTELGPTGTITCLVVSDHIEITGLSTGKHLITLYDPMGRAVAGEQVQALIAHTTRMPLPPVADGIYLLSVDGRGAQLFIQR